MSSQNLEAELIEREERYNRLRRLRDRFAALTLRQQQVIRMLYVEDRTGKEIAATLGITYKAFRIAKEEAMFRLRS